MGCHSRGRCNDCASLRVMIMVHDFIVGDGLEGDRLGFDAR